MSDRGEAGGLGRVMHDRLTRMLSTAMLVVGVLLVARALAGGSIIGVVLGVAFVAAGVGRLYVQHRLSRARTDAATGGGSGTTPIGRS